MKWVDVFMNKSIPNGWLSYEWFAYKRDHLGDYDFSDCDWWDCLRNFMNEEIDEEFIARYKDVSKIDC